jgi:uncharacterized membrane protein (UPF0127 family)
MLVNRRTGKAIANEVEVASTRRSRRRGLLGRDALDADAALILTPCCAVHTAFMRFAIDVVFVNREGEVLRIVRALPPWRVACSPRAHEVFELAAGRLQAGDLAVGDVVYLAPAPLSVAERPAASSSLRATAARPACSGS